MNTPLRVNATDISGNGCYVETVMPLPIGTALRVDLWIEQERLTPSAVVRTRDPGVGMGIEFTGLPEESKKRFQAHLDKLDPGMAFSQQRGPIAPSVVSPRLSCKICNHCPFQPSNDRADHEKAAPRT